MSDERIHRPNLSRWLIGHPRWMGLPPVLVYLILMVPAVCIRRAQINPDAVCYIRLAGYLLRGDWAHAFSGYWSPLLPGCLAPLMAGGLDGLWGARVAIALFGLLYLLAADRLLRRFDGMTPTMTPAMRLAVMLVTALFTVRLAVKIITPDLPMAAALLGYLALVRDRDGNARPRRFFLAGVMGGAAYLAKAYALPFVLAHLPMTLLIQRWQHRQRASRIAVAWGAGMLGLALPAVPWIALLSHDYGRLTMGTAGRFNHNNVDHAPPEVQYHPLFFIPPDPYIVENEIKDRRMTGAWNPLASRDNLRRQWAIARDNAPRILAALGGFDGAWLVPLSIIAALGFAMIRGKPHGDIPWLAMTVAVYCAGFLFVYFEPRLIEAAMRFPAMLLCVSVAGRFKARAAWIPIAVFAVSAIAGLPGAFRAPEGDEIYRQAAVALRDIHVTGPIAANNRGVGTYVAYFLDAKLITLPPTDSPAEIDRYCREAGVRCLVIGHELPGKDGPSSAVEQLAHDGGWKRVQQLSNIRVGMEVYVRAIPE
jgi:hypothetical protein